MSGNKKKYDSGREPGLDFQKLEKEMLNFWKERRIFEKSLAKTKKGKPFTFYDGPPFATGLPHYGHILASTIKDVIPRYQTMRGRFVRRRWGWDCHGLPIEEIVERKLKISGKKQIEKIGIRAFNETCRSTVLAYAAEWGKMIERIARWVEFEDSYKTMDATFMESVWWAFKEIHKKKLAYEGRRVLLYCPRCETPVSNFEVAMDDSYRTIMEEAVTVKFRIRPGQKIGKWIVPENTFILAWTTTPWTLPGNVALAVGRDTKYAILENKFFIGSGGQWIGSGTYILAKETVWKAINSNAFLSNELKTFDLFKERDRLSKDLVRFARNSDKFFEEYKIPVIKGENLVRLQYEPLFDIAETKTAASHRVYAADFVTTDDGTGIVHTAVVYGEEDYALGVREGLPVVPLLDEKGIFNDKAPKFIRGLYFKDAEAAIKNDLAARNLLFLKEAHTHSYPHCWRCGNILFYNAIPAWFINIQKIKPGLLKSNAKEVNWFPGHLKHGRYEKSVQQAPDWNISRNRYWGNPIPVWRCEKCRAEEVMGSLEELSRRAPAKNRYFAMRHGHSEAMMLGIADNDLKTFHLTPTGEKQAKAAAAKLRKQNIDLIYASPIQRTRETAEIISRAFGTPVHFDERLKEINIGEFEHQPVSRYHAYFSSTLEKFSKRPPEGETLRELKARLWSFVSDMETRHSGKTILIISHEYSIWMLWALAEGVDDAEAARKKDRIRGDFVGPAEAKPLLYKNLPRADSGDVDLHRPYVDEVVLACKSCGGTMRRITEIFDSWTEAGSMPFAEYHYPFENARLFRSRYPAQFVAEYIAQTRAWFYTMHVVSFILFGRAPFENVVTTGTILAEDGSKMSKSKGNFPDPWEVIEKYGVDSLRFYLMNSPVMQADNLNFSTRDLESVHRKVVLILWNVCNYFTMYAGQRQASKGKTKKAIIDRWIEGRTHDLAERVTAHLDSYDTVKATRTIAEYIDDLSRWYVRRNRGRTDSAFFDTLAESLLAASKIIAPFMPYLAEMVYRSVVSHVGKRAQESVHLADWPKADKKLISQNLFAAMNEIRRLASLALAKRTEAGIKLRQPLSDLKIKSLKFKDSGLIELLRDEVNVKKVTVDPELASEIELDTSITPELREEGMVRELIRNIQEMRKEAGLKPGERIRLHIEGSDILEKWRGLIKRGAGAADVLSGGKRAFSVERKTNINGREIWIGIKKI